MRRKRPCRRKALSHTKISFSNLPADVCINLFIERFFQLGIQRNQKIHVRPPPILFPLTLFSYIILIVLVILTILFPVIVFFSISQKEDRRKIRLSPVNSYF